MRQKRQQALKQSVSFVVEKDVKLVEVNQVENQLKKSKTIATTLELKDFEPVKKKSINERKNMFETKETEDKVEIEKKTGKQKVADKVKRVKSLLMEGSKTEPKSTEKKVTKQKA